MPTITYSNIERMPCTAVTGPTIAKNVPDKYFPSLAPSGIRMSMISSLPYSGWLLKFPLDVLPLTRTGTVTLAYDRRDDDRVAMYAQAVETDLMGVMPDGRVANWSGQDNVADGHWQIVNGLYKWVDAAPVQPMVADAWTNFRFDYAWNFDKGTSSVVGGSIGGALFDVDPTLQNIPAVPLKWTGDRIILQLQQTGNANPGAWSTEFREVGVTVAYDQV